MSSENGPDNRRTAGKLLLVVVAMFGFGFLLVPLYNVMCDALGINGRFTDIEAGQVDISEQERRGRLASSRVDESREITVQFLTALNQNLNWEFRAMENAVTVHPGQIMEVRFYAKNLTGREVVGQAVPSIVPGRAFKYFTKMECFCFSKQVLKPGEEVEMPLRFVVNPDLPKDIRTISLAYTFFDTENRNGRVSIGDDAGLAVAQVTHR
ncbi:MAG TPA: cytochrome c oxidase assembly protein [Gammaproteobacteria bacterium]|nr:cytochrome c oxidase assembly protein [Gammaproteobacteria bacterium]